MAFIKKNYGIIVQRNTVINVLEEINPERDCCLLRRKYVSEGPNSSWHADSYNKLKPYGLPIHGCIDGYLRRTL